ncbi:protein phosphatase 1 regulatory subunit 15B-like [Pristis pectinata]|uniref:protein phosphatase 1 regulatory subunit 15B-like n=1 Tax=Pristis pectinata TaxID=685728 RepID=UPI00223D63D2|nr:protein phosphatase 1 regulatory subunit 15B-like [Pristis pectinata]
MVPVKHLHSQDSPTLLARVNCTVSVLWHCGQILLTQFRVFFGLLTKLHTVLLLSRSSHLKPIENRPSSNEQVVEVKKLLNRFGKAGSTIDAGNLQCGFIQTAKGINSQLTLNKCNLNDHKRISMPPVISENSAPPSTEKNYCQHYLNNKFNQDHFRDDGNCMTDCKCVAVRYPVNQCTITKLTMREWNNIVADQEDCSSIDNEEWGDSDEESDTQCNSYESLSDEEQNEILWNSFFTADPYNPLNFAAQLTSSSTKIVGEDLKEQCLEENVKRRNIAQKPILPQRHFQHFCKLGTRENVKLHVWKKSSKCTKSEEGDKVMSKPASKKLRFSPVVEVHIMVAWSFALREARKGHWIQVANDRARFLHRVHNTELAIGYCLHKDHRLKIWEKIHSQARIM